MVDVSKSDLRFKRALGGQYEFVAKGHNRDSYKHKTKDYYLFYIGKQYTDGKPRWVIEPTLAGVKNEQGYEYYGLIRHEGDEICPTDVGKKWYQFWDKKKVDPNILITCGNKYFKFIHLGENLVIKI